MPQTKSAKKALRQSLRRRLVNLTILAKLKEAIKNFKKKPTEDNFVEVQVVADIAAKKKVISKNRAARIKSKLAKVLLKKKELKTKRPLTKKSPTSSLRKTKK